jgi:hypothetical protein
LTEHELTKLTTLVSDIARKLEVSTPIERELEEVKRDVAPEAVLDAIESKHD